MNSVPFLVQFKKERTVDVLSNSVILKYDPNTDQNILEHNNIFLMAMTKTQIKTEKPDEALDEINNTELRRLYLQTKTFTEVKSELSDKNEENFYSSFLYSQTFTRSKGEGTDSN